MRSWLRLALRSDIAGRGLKTALMVGTILTVINYGDVLADNTVTLTILIKIVLNYLIPYCVSTYAGVEALADEQREWKQNN
jgi:hypothetical protein